ncbi:hypothetical protein BDV98DRAFT_598005 [Pterulicium gracile]|uniref:Uncharacterized protein n=1 Tax=Pterulicium gracile TaxID=1884261 RepID=A0A5C3Q4T0_9AGAR|nr:hypothetical protein BDV98DRAFT_598005 [Pterula gracilis]
MDESTTGNKPQPGSSREIQLTEADDDAQREVDNRTSRGTKKRQSSLPSVHDGAHTDSYCAGNHYLANPKHPLSPDSSSSSSNPTSSNPSSSSSASSKPASEPMSCSNCGTTTANKFIGKRGALEASPMGAHGSLIRCATCYSYFYNHGTERPSGPLKPGPPSSKQPRAARGGSVGHTGSSTERARNRDETQGSIIGRSTSVSMPSPTRGASLSTSRTHFFNPGQPLSLSPSNTNDELPLSSLSSSQAQSAGQYTCSRCAETWSSRWARLVRISFPTTVLCKACALRIEIRNQADTTVEWIG